jgi:SET domain-containing protein
MAPSAPIGLAPSREPFIRLFREIEMTEIMPHRNLYTRLKASAHGVGVFAIRDIPAGMRLFEGDLASVVRVSRQTVDQIKDAELRRMYFDFCPTHENAFIAPADFNQITMSWYMNHSSDPNVRADAELRFVTSRPIHSGEELTTDYTTFSEHASTTIARWPDADDT